MGRNAALDLRQFSDGNNLVDYVAWRVAQDPTRLYVRHEMAAVEARLEALGCSKPQAAAHMVKVRAAARRTLRNVTCQFQAGALLGASDDELAASALKTSVGNGWGAYVIGMASAVRPRILERGAEVGIIPILRSRATKAPELVSWMRTGYEDLVRHRGIKRAEAFSEVKEMQGLFAHCNYALTTLQLHPEHGVHATFRMDGRDFVIAHTGSDQAGDMVLVRRDLHGMQLAQKYPNWSLYRAQLPVVSTVPPGKLTDANCPRFN